jgi:hypothetical protein
MDTTSTKSKFKLDLATMVEFLIVGAILLALYGLFGAWLNEKGAEMHGSHPALPAGKK